MMQLVAMAAMLADHIGLVFFPDNETYRIVGRVAFPLYCWFLVQGYLHTRDVRKYMIRLFGLAVLSQIPYSLALGKSDLNVIFTLLLALAGLYAADRLSTDTGRMAMLALVLGTAALVPMDYGLYGVLLVFIYRHSRGWMLIGLHLLLNGLFWAMNGMGHWIQLYSIAGSLIIALPLPLPGRLPWRWVYRTFYPVHLVVLSVLSFG